MAKEKVYISQFNDIDDSVENNKQKPQICVKCNKESVSLYEGVCFDCRQKISNKTNNDSKSTILNTFKELRGDKNAPNIDLYYKYTNEWYDKFLNGEASSLTSILASKLFMPRTVWLILAIVYETPYAIMCIINSLLFLVGVSFFILAFVNNLIYLIAGLILFGTSIIIRTRMKKIRQKLIDKKFEKYNKRIVKINEYGEWDCPSCRLLNTKTEHCERCGVLPIIKK